MLSSSWKSETPSSSAWVVSLSCSPPATTAGYTTHRLGPANGSQHLYLSSPVGSHAPLSAESAGGCVLLGGVMFSAGQVQDDFIRADKPELNAAQVILDAYAQHGESLLPKLRGQFALVIWDAQQKKLLCLRDPLGTHPLFYSQAPNGFFVSPSIEALLEQPGVSRRLNTATMAGYLLQRFGRGTETFFENVNRIETGHALRHNHAGTNTYRYWDPSPDEDIDWLTSEELERFDDTFDQAVSRCLSTGSSSVFLSGGLDSVSVAAVALQRSRIENRNTPVALSVAFPTPATNEEAVQRSVAQQLQLPQVVKPFFEAVGAPGLMSPALSLSCSLPAPLLNFWLPVYYALARDGEARGCKAILTGNGGDEWLTLGPYFAADLVRRFDVLGFYRLWRSHCRSYPMSGFAVFRTLIWRFGLAPVILPPAHRAAKRFAPWAIGLRHRLMWQKPEWILGDWIAPDLELRRRLNDRIQRGEGVEQNKKSTHYDRAGRVGLGHTIMSWEMEELFHVYQRLGLRIFHPYWDADLIELLYRVPPFQLNSGGRTKGLVRDSLARRFPQLGFERQRKMMCVDFYRDLIEQDARAKWKELGGTPCLTSLGIIDEEKNRTRVEHLLGHMKDSKDAFRVWTVLNLETWARAQVS